MSTEALLNKKGDVLKPTTGSHGADIASQRMDGLDKACLKFVLDECAPQSNVIDLGCGLGTQSLRLGSLGMRVCMIDLLDLSEFAARANNLLGSSLLYAIQKNARDLTPRDLPDDVACVYAQRFIHYLPYGEARDLLSLVHSQMRQGAQVFISAGAFESELRNGYEHETKPIEERFGVLSPEMAEKHGIHERLVLYSPNELATLMVECGFTTHSISKSEFGTPKGIFVK